MERVERSEQRPGLLVVDNETKSTATRVTVEGRTITYCMKVIQQPERARACGQGAKSSADRRPVDPPPIVELRIFEGDKAQTDITFTMNANYFLYAELQHARNMAQGRLPQDRTMPPVLTGTPVAGIAYLDRPTPAGYFIFPDLSVRHEGKYRLSFSLYEELKSPKDEDKPEQGAPLNAAGESHVTHRLEVKSEPFVVFSAKKFPGLTESTSLSRMVAEQGCRVRIRRDVRMRRREPKSGGKDWDEYEDETAAARSRMSATPDPSMYSSLPAMEAVPRPRSPSSSSLQSNLSRRPSLQDINQAYPPQYDSQPHTPQSSGNFGQPSPFGPAPGPQIQQASMQPPPPQYPSQAYQAPPPPPSIAAAPLTQQGHYPPAASPAPQSQYIAPPRAYEPAARSNMEFSTPAKPDFRRSSVQYPTPAPPPTAYAAPPPPPPSYAAQMSHPPPAPQPSYSQPTDMYAARPAPLEPIHPPTRATGASTPLPTRPSYDLPPLNTTLSAAAAPTKLEASSPVAAGPSHSYFSTYQPSESNKRSYGRVFSDRHQHQPLRHGARPTSYTSNEPLLSAADDDDDDEASGELDVNLLGMHYRRADGRQILRALPPQS